MRAEAKFGEVMEQRIYLITKVLAAALLRMRRAGARMAPVA